MSIRTLAPLFAAALLALGGSPQPGEARVGGYRIVLASDLEGGMHGYTIRLDGSRLTRVLPTRRPLAPFAVSRDGRTIAYSDERAIYVSRGDGTHLHRVIRGEFSYPALSPDGGMVAYTFGSRNSVAVVGTNGRGRRVLRSSSADEIAWSPDNRTLVYTVRDREGRPSIAIQPLRGARRLLVKTGSSARWSPDGRWIAYRGYGLGVNGVVRPDGRSNHRLLAGTEFDWSPDSRRLAVVGAQGISIVTVGGRVTRRIHIARFASLWKVLWSPDGRRLLYERSEPRQLWTVGADGRGTRRVTRWGNNFALGWTRLVPIQRPIPRPAPSVRVLGPRTVATTRPVAALSADGGRVAFPADATAADCAHISVWTPGSRSLARSFTPTSCGWPSGSRIYDVELAGRRVAWATEFSCGNTCSDALESSLLGAHSRQQLAEAGHTNGDTPPDFHVRGQGDLLVFNDRARLVRVGSGNERCQEGFRVAVICSTIRRGEHATAADSVSGELIAILEGDAVAVLNARGELVRVFPFAAGAATGARIDGTRLVVSRAGAVEVYDASTGAPLWQQPVPSRFRLVDVDGGIAVLIRNNVVMLLRLQDGRSRTLTPGRSPVLAELEPAGLYYSYGVAGGAGRVAFLPRSEAEPAERAG